MNYRVHFLTDLAITPFSVFFWTARYTKHTYIHLFVTRAFSHSIESEARAGWGRVLAFMAPNGVQKDGTVSEQWHHWQVTLGHAHRK